MDANETEDPAMTLSSPTLCVLLAFAVPEGAARLDPGDGTVYVTPPGRSSTLVPFRCVANQVRLEATVNGRGPIHLILDTGMPDPGIILFRGPRVDALGLGDAGTRERLSGAGGTGESREAVVSSPVSMTLGELAMSNVPAMVLPERSGMPPSLDGIIGGTLFFRYVVRVDMDLSRLELFEPSGWSPAAGVCVVPLHRVRGAVFVPVRVAVGPGEPIDAELVVDLGAGHAVALNARPTGALSPPAESIEAPLGRGLSGAVRGRIGRLLRFEIGSFAFENVVASFPVAEHRHPGGFDFRDGNLGVGILKRFNVTFDYASSRMVLEKSRQFDDPFEHDMSGLALEWREDGAVSVRSVLAGSPAAEAGVEAGDRLLGIDGRPIDEIGEGGLGGALRRSGAEVALTLGRGANTFVKRLRLRRLV